MAVVTDIEHLYTLLPTNGIIAIDGVDGSGKSTLARLLADNIGAAWFELDSYISRRNGIENYTENLCYENLRSQLAEEQSRLIVIEGVFLKDVSIRTKVKFDLHIYCRKVEIHLYGKKSTDTFEDSDNAPFANAFRDYLGRNNLPHSADVIFEWEVNNF